MALTANPSEYRDEVSLSSEMRIRAAEQEEPVPVTSRSPSFVRIRSSESRDDESLEGAVAVVDVTVHETVRPAPAQLRAAALLRWADLDVALRVDSLRLEDILVWSSVKSSADTLLRELLEDVGEVSKALCSLCATDEGAEGALIQHTYEWASNIVARARAIAARTGEYADLPIDEYSSLFVRSILDPMIEASLEARERAHDDCAIAKLDELRQRMVWLNWTARRLREKPRLDSSLAGARMTPSRA